MTSTRVAKELEKEIGNVCGKAFKELYVGQEFPTRIANIFPNTSAFTARSAVVAFTAQNEGQGLINQIAENEQLIKDMMDFGLAEMVGISALVDPVKMALAQAEAATGCEGHIGQQHMLDRIKVSGLGNLMHLAGKDMEPLVELFHHIENLVKMPKAVLTTFWCAF